MNLGGDDVEGVGSDGETAELERGHLALELPQIAVDIEDSSAEKIAQYGGELFPFGVIVEIRFEHVFNVFWVGGDYIAENMNMDGAGGRFGEEMGVPVAKIVVL